MKQTQREKILTETETNNLGTVIGNFIIGILGIMSIVFILLQLPIFGIDWFNGQSAVYAALAGVIALCCCCCYLRRDIFSYKDAIIFSFYIIWIFLIILFFRNLWLQENISHNIFNLLIAVCFLIMAIYGVKKYWTEDMPTNY